MGVERRISLTFAYQCDQKETQKKSKHLAGSGKKLCTSGV